MTKIRKALDYRNFEPMRQELLALREKNAKLEAELKWAWDNMTFTEYPPADDAEYEFCKICHEPEWKHDADCKGIEHKKSANALLEESHVQHNPS